MIFPYNSENKPRGPLRQIFLGGGGGLYMDEYLLFENASFCSSNSNFLRFSAHDLSLLLIFTFTFVEIL